MKFTRRSFVSTIAPGLVAASALGIAPMEGQLVYQHSDWKSADFEKLLNVSATTRQVYDIRGIDEGKFLNNIKNSLNGFHFGFGIPLDDVKIVAAMHGPSNMLNFDDSMWAKYKLGEWLKVNDPLTGKPADRNVFVQKTTGTSRDPNDKASIFQATSIAALQNRGVQFLSCHTATEEQVHALIGHLSLTTPAEKIVEDLQAHTIPGVLVVPAMVATIALLQSRGHYSYITV